MEQAPAPPSLEELTNLINGYMDQLANAHLAYMPDNSRFVAEAMRIRQAARMHGIMIHTGAVRALMADLGGDGKPRSVRRRAKERLRESRALEAVPSAKAADPKTADPKAIGPEAVDKAANEAATSPRNKQPAPSEAQKAAGNYKHGSVKLFGLDIAIENPKGSVRSGRDRDGKEWRVTMPAHYGYIRRSDNMDGEQLDVFIGPDPTSTKVCLVFQRDPGTGLFDEIKAMLGYRSVVDAKADYVKSYSDGQGKKRIWQTQITTVRRFQKWLKRNDPPSSSA